MGAILKPSGCCCGEEEAPSNCTNCDWTPKYFTVTLSGVEASLCTGCYPNTGSSGGNFAVGGIDGIHLLTQGSVLEPSAAHSQYCLWVLPAVGSYSYDWWGGAGCVGAPWISRSGDCGMFLRRTASGWQFQIGSVWAATAWMDLPLSTPWDRTIFNDTVTEPDADDCLTVPNMSNDLICAGGGIPWHLCNGGIATFDAGDQT